MYPRGYNSSTYNPHFLPDMWVENNYYFSPRQSVRPFGTLQPDVISLSNWIDGPIGFGNEFTGFMPYPYLPVGYLPRPQWGAPVLPRGYMPRFNHWSGPVTGSSPVDLTASLVDALNNKDTQAVNQLIQQGADVTATDPKSGKSLLSIAVAAGNADDVKALINAVPKDKQKDYINKQDDQSGQTVLFDAGKSNNKDVVNALIDAGADTNIKDKTGTNVYDYVKKNVPDVDADLLKSLSPTVTVDGVTGVKIATADMSDDEINTVKDYVKFMSQDADGAKLLKAASQDGDVTISYEPSFKDGMGGDTAGHHIRLSKKVIDNEAKAKGDPTNIMGLGAMAHEFVHAATEGDDDSKQEESLATTIGTRIAGRYYNKPVDEQKIYDDWINGQINNDAYKDMKVDNNIFSDVSNLGIDVSNIHEHDPVKS